MSIEIRDISKRFGETAVLDHVTLTVESGELLAFLGPSGSGKTTLLRIIAGLEMPDEGEIYFHGESATDKKTKDRGVGFVFQHYALFRHMTVFENVAFGLRVKPRKFRLSESQIREKVHELLKLVQLDWVAGRYPNQLSGGQRQRIALARALAVEPRVLLLDEPFGALDAKVRQELRTWLRRFHDELAITTIFVTHDQEEALEVSDRVVVMNHGRIEQVGTPEQVYHHPATPFVMQFLGHVNLFHCRVEDGKGYFGNVPVSVASETDGSHTPVYIRPHQLTLSRAARSPRDIQAKIQRVHPAGSVIRIHLTTDSGETVQVDLTPLEFQSSRFLKGEMVFVVLRQGLEDYSI